MVKYNTFGDLGLTFSSTKHGPTDHGRLLGSHRCHVAAANQNSYFSLQGTKGAIESPRGPSGPDGQQDLYKAYFSDGLARNFKGLKWENFWNYSYLLPENYQNLLDAAKELAAQGDYRACGGDYYVVQDFIKTIKGEINNPVDVYAACEWTAVALLSEISAQNGARPVKMPNFKGDRQDMQLKL